MKKAKSQFVAIIALVFMAIFTVSLILAYAVPSLLNGQIGFVALFFGVFGLALFFCAKTYRKNEVLEEREKESAEKDKDSIIIDASLDENSEDGSAKVEDGSAKVEDGSAKVDALESHNEKALDSNEKNISSVPSKKRKNK